MSTTKRTIDAAAPPAAPATEEEAGYPLPSSLNLHQRKLRVMADVEQVVKRGQTAYGERYSYARIDDVMAAVRPAMARHGIDLRVRPSLDYSRREVFGPTKSGAMQYIWTIWVEFTLTNADDPQDVEVTMYPGEGIDTADKGPGKAISYATKNFLLKAFLLPSGDEADNEAFAPETTAKPQPPKTAEDRGAIEHRRAQSAFFAALNGEGIDKDAAKRWLARNFHLQTTRDASIDQLKAARTWALGYADVQAELQAIVAQGGIGLESVAAYIRDTIGAESPEVMTLAEWQRVLDWARSEKAAAGRASIEALMQEAADELDAALETPEEEL